MPVYAYSAQNRRREDYTETGAVVASNEREAMDKVKALDFEQVTVKRIRGIKGLIKMITADVK